MTSEAALRPRRLNACVTAFAPSTGVIVAMLTVLAAILRFTRLGHQSFWYDEAFTVSMVHHTPGQMLGLLPQTELTPPLYFCLIWAWAHVFGYGEAALRSLSAVAGVATVVAIYGAAAKLVSRRAGLIAAALAASNPLLIWYSQEARAYALLVLFAALSLFAFAYARLPDRTARSLAAWAVAAGLALTTHYYAVVAVAPQAAWLLWTGRRDRRVIVAIGAVVAVGLALLPLALSQRSKANWIAGWPLDQRLEQIGPQLVLGTGAHARTWLKLVAAAALLLAGVLLARRGKRSERRGAVLAGGLAAGGFLLSLAFAAAGTDEVITRNLLPLVAPLIVLVAGGLGARRAGIAGAAGGAALCAVGLIATISVATDPLYQRPNWRALARAIGSGPPVGAERLVLLERYPHFDPLAVYLPGLRFAARSGAIVNELDVVAYKGGPRHTWFCWWGSTCNLKPARLDASLRLRGLRAEGIFHVARFSVLRLRAPVPVRVTPQEVANALRTTKLRFDGLLVQPPG